MSMYAAQPHAQRADSLSPLFQPMRVSTTSSFFVQPRREQSEFACSHSSCGSATNASLDSLPDWLVRRMAANNAVSLVIGLVPLVGDIGLAVWRANSRNVKLLEEVSTLSFDSHALVLTRSPCAVPACTRRGAHCRGSPQPDSSSTSSSGGGHDQGRRTRQGRSSPSAAIDQGVRTLQQRRSAHRHAHPRRWHECSCVGLSCCYACAYRRCFWRLQVQHCQVVQVGQEVEHWRFYYAQRTLSSVDLGSTSPPYNTLKVIILISIPKPKLFTPFYQSVPSLSFSCRAFTLTLDYAPDLCPLSRRVIGSLDSLLRLSAICKWILNEA